MRYFVIPENFFKELSKNENKLYVRVWWYWLSEFADQIFEPDFLEKQREKYPISEITDIYQSGIQLLSDFQIKEPKGKPKTPKTREELIIAGQVIDYFNSICGTTYTTKSNADIVIARMKEGYTISDFKIVIEKQYKRWKNTELEKYLRPNTLFQKSKFENYLNSRDEQPASTIKKFADSVAKAKALVGLRKNT